jgi:hypothetical protein
VSEYLDSDFNLYMELEFFNPEQELLTFRLSIFDYPNYDVCRMVADVDFGNDLDLLGFNVTEAIKGYKCKYVGKYFTASETDDYGTIDIENVTYRALDFEMLFEEYDEEDISYDDDFEDDIYDLFDDLADADDIFDTDDLEDIIDDTDDLEDIENTDGLEEIIDDLEDIIDEIDDLDIENTDDLEDIIDDIDDLDIDNTDDLEDIIDEIDDLEDVRDDIDDLEDIIDDIDDLEDIIDDIDDLEDIENIDDLEDIIDDIDDLEDIIDTDDLEDIDDTDDTDVSDIDFSFDIKDTLFLMADDQDAVTFMTTYPMVFLQLDSVKVNAFSGTLFIMEDADSESPLTCSIQGANYVNGIPTTVKILDNMGMCPIA